MRILLLNGYNNFLVLFSIFSTSFTMCLFYNVSKLMLLVLSFESLTNLYHPMLL